jgi:hypothetical protein
MALYPGDPYTNQSSIPSYGVSTSSAGTSNTADDDDGSINVPVYQLRTFDPSGPLAGRSLQDVYGTSAMPYFDFVKRIQTGTVTFDPADPYHREAADAFGFSPDAPGTAAMLAQVGGSVAQALISKASSLATSEVGKGALESFLDPDANLAFFENIPAAAKSYLPGYTSTGAEKTAALRAAQNLSKGQTLVPADQISIYGTPAGKMQTISGKNYFPVKDANVGIGQAAMMNPATYKGFTSDYLSAGEVAADALLSPGGDDFVMGGPSGAADYLSSQNISGTSGGFMEDTLGSTFSTEPGGGLAPGSPTAASVGVGFGVSLGVGLLMGQKPKEAVKNAAFQTAGSVIGTAIGGPIGGFIGGSIGGMVGGRVICNELCRQGFLTRKDVMLDYKFTVEHLTPIHVNGYHIWSLGVVRKLREGKGIKLWHHIAKHRANEIAYIYGERDKPDYLGKIYRHIGEPLCYAMGIFCKRTDWSVLYQKKEA